MTDAVLENESGRLLGLCDPEQNLLGFAPTSETDDGVYYLTVREWPHPDVDGAHIVSIRYAYLTRGSGTDGWVDGGGVELRVEGDPQEFVGDLARLMAACKPRVGGEKRPVRDDLRPTEE